MIKIGLIKKKDSDQKVPNKHKDMIIFIPVINYLVLADSYFWWDVNYNHHNTNQLKNLSLVSLQQLISDYLKHIFSNVIHTSTNDNHFIFIPFDLSDQYESGILIKSAPDQSIQIAGGMVTNATYGNIPYDEMIRSEEHPRIDTRIFQLSQLRLEYLLNVIPPSVQILDGDWEKFFWP